MSKFKVSDWVICMNNGFCDLMDRQLYEVEDVDIDGYVKLIGTGSYYFPERFELYSTKIQPPSRPAPPMPQVNPPKAEEIEIPIRKTPEKQLLEIKYAGMTVTLDPAKLESKKFATNIIDAIYEQGE